MGACATKPKVLKDSDDKPTPLPPMPSPQKEEEEKVAQREVASVAPIESPAATKSPSLGNLFIKEIEDAKASPGNEIKNAATSSQVNESIKAPEVGKENAEALEVLPTPAIMADGPIEKGAIKEPEIISKQNTAALNNLPEPTATTMVDIPIEKEALKAPEVVASTEKIKSQASEDYADALPAPASPKLSVADGLPPSVLTDSNALPPPASPVLADAPTEKLAVIVSEIVNNEIANDSVNVKKMVEEEKSSAESLDNLTAPVKIVPQLSEEFTDAIGTDEVVKTGDEKLIKIDEEKKPENTEYKKIVDQENAVIVEKQIEVAESNKAAEESDIKEVKSVEILPKK